MQPPAAGPAGGAQPGGLPRHQFGVVQAEFDRFINQAHVSFAPSASAGDSLRSLNDHAGVLVVRTGDGTHTVAERLAVVKDGDRYYAKGYGDRLVRLDALIAWVDDNKDAAAAAPGPADIEAGVSHVGPRPPRMGTPFRQFLRGLSEASTLGVRREASQSEAVITPLPLHPAALPQKSTEWGNGENDMMDGFGPEDPAHFRTFYLDFNATENRLVLFKRDPGDALARVDDEAQDPDVPPHKGVFIRGPILAEIHGIKQIEPMGPAGLLPGVKNATLKGLLRRALRQPNSGVQLRITTEDGVVHDLRLTDRGAKLRLVNPRPGSGSGNVGASFGNGKEVQADFDVYHYEGRDTGPRGSPDGFADPQLGLSTGELLKAGPLLFKAVGVRRQMARLGTAAGHMLVLQPALGGARSVAANVANTVIGAAAQALLVAGFNEAAKEIQDNHDNRTFFPGGTRAFSSTGTGPVAFGPLFAATFSFVVAQQAVSLLLTLGARFMPATWKQTEGRVRSGVLNIAAPATEEFGRLCLNYGIQRGFGLPRGDGRDVLMLLPQSAAHGLLEFARVRAGQPENHLAATALLDMAEFAQTTVFRAMGNVLGHDGQLRKDLGEALVARLLTRGPDKLLLPVVASLANHFGVFGPNASAFNHQLDAENAMGLQSALSSLRTVVDGVSAGARKLELDIWESSPVGDALQRADDKLDAIQYTLDQWLLPLWGRDRIDEEVDAVRAASRHARLNSLPRAEQDAYRDEMTARMNQMIADARQLRGPNPGPDAAGARAVTYRRDELPPTHRRFMARLDAAAEQPVAPAMAGRNASRYPVVLGHDSNRPRPRDATPPAFSLLSDTPRVKRDKTTFSATAQAYAKSVHAEMAKRPGITSIRERRRLSARVKERILAAVRDYTAESQYFHYPLRWDVTGEPRIIELAPGIDFSYNIMNARGNTSGALDRQFDPIKALYINLGALHAEKFPAIVQRAVVTEARYGAPVGGNNPGRPPLRNVEQNAHVALTEIFSATSSSRLSAAFGQARGFGAFRKDRTQRLVIQQETAVNIAPVTELVQAETIMMPGAVFTVLDIDRNAGRRPGEQAADIGQVVYLRAVDTHELERRAPDYPRAPGETAQTAHGQDYVSWRTGHFYRWDAQRAEHVYDNVQNYFLGKKMDWETRPPAGVAALPPRNIHPESEVAHWREPYTSNAATRATKDAIHAAILRDDPIVPHLNQATKNVHHAYYRKKGGYTGSAAQRQEAGEQATTRQRAATVAQRIADLELTSALTAHGAGAPNDAPTTELLAWLTTSLLRKPIEVIPVEVEQGVPRVNMDPALVRTFQGTYDRVDLSTETPVLIGQGVGPLPGTHGYYTIHHRDGQWRPQRIHAEDPPLSVANFLHAFFRAAYAKPAQYLDVDDLAQPDRASQRSVAGLLERLKGFSATDYLLLQGKLVTEAQRWGMALPAAGA